MQISAPLLLAAYVVSFAAGVGLRLLIGSRLVASVISWLLWPVVVFALLLPLWPIELPAEAAPLAFTVVAAGLLWWLGARLAGRYISYETVLSEFQVGLLVLVGLLFLSYVLHLEQSSLVPAAIVFVGLGLAGAATTRANEGGGLPLPRRSNTWWAMLLLSMSLVFLLGFLVALLFTPDLMHLLGQGIRALWHLLERLMSALAGLFGTEEAPAELPPVPQITGQQSEPEFSLTLPDSWLRPSRIAYGVFIGVLVLVMIWRLTLQLFAWARRRTDRGDVRVEHLRGAFRADLLNLLRRLISWVKALSLLGRIRQRATEKMVPSISVRRLYTEMVRWGARSGIPRMPSQTPLEYLDVLCAAFPAYRSEVMLITQGYVRARYAAQVLNEEDVQQLKASRRRLKRKASRRHRT